MRTLALNALALAVLLGCHVAPATCECVHEQCTTTMTVQLMPVGPNGDMVPFPVATDDCDCDRWRELVEGGCLPRR